MMNQETYVKVPDLRRQGWTIGEIAADRVPPGDDLDLSEG